MQCNDRVDQLAQHQSTHLRPLTRAFPLSLSLFHPWGLTCPRGKRGSGRKRKELAKHRRHSSLRGPWAEIGCAETQLGSSDVCTLLSLRLPRPHTAGETDRDTRTGVNHINPT